MNPINPAASGESASHRNVYQIVTEQIIRQLEQGVAPWHKPWRTEAPCNLVSGKPYRGINVFLLASQGYESRYWLTFNQATKLGGHVKKGEHSWEKGRSSKMQTGTSVSAAISADVLQGIQRLPNRGHRRKTRIRQGCS